MAPQTKRTRGAVKRKAADTTSAGSAKKAKSNISQGKDAEKFGIVQRQFYPPEMTNDRVHAYRSGQLEKPIDYFKRAAAETEDDRGKIEVKDAVVHWFKCDLRTKDNTGLHMASKKAQAQGVPLIGVYLVSPQDYQAHCTSAVRVDFIIRTLKVLQEDLAQLDIPLHVETLEKRKDLPARLIELCHSWGAAHIFANVEYEVDELRREANLFKTCLDSGITLEAFEDTCVVNPYSISSLSGGQYSVYSPWYRAWLRYLNERPEQLNERPPPASNPPAVREAFGSLFDSQIPDAPANKALSDNERMRFANMWPAGEGEAYARLQKFINKKLRDYKANRDFPGGNSTSVLSVHLAAGTLAARTCIREAQSANKPSEKIGYRYAKKLEEGDAGLVTWIAEVAWRDWYRHQICMAPWVVMNKPHRPEYSNIEWEYDTEKFNAWKDGRTGYPIVDAAMRQLKHSGYMHNRCRMISASFLAKDLLLDWRMGEREFMLSLIDGDFASNNGGWSFCVGCGADTSSAYYRIFSPIRQSERFDPKGEYIRKWIPELAGVIGDAIHDPYGRGAEHKAQAAGYPRPIVEHSSARQRALERFKAGLQAGSPSS